MLPVMEGQGRGSVLLLLFTSSLLLCKDVASEEDCDRECIQEYGKLSIPMITEAQFMLYLGKSIMEQFEKKFLNGSSYLSEPFHICHTAEITLPDETSKKWEVKHEQRLKYAISLLNSWREPLQFLVKQSHLLGELGAYVKYDVSRIAEHNQNLEDHLKYFAVEFDYEITTDVEYAPFLGYQILRTTGEFDHHLLYQNIFRCFFYDIRKIVEYFKELLIHALNYDKC